MEEKHRDAINENMETLVSQSNFESIVQVILNNYRDLFLESQLKEFERPEFKQKGEEEKCHKFYKTIQTRGPTAYSSLLEILKESNNHTCYKLLRNPERSTQPPEKDKIVLKKACALPSDPLAFKMASYPRGLYLIINNQKFSDDIAHKFRRGAQRDKFLADVLDKMDFCGDYHENKTVWEMNKLLLDFRSNEKLAEVDCCIVALMSHGQVIGGYDCIIGSDSLPIRRYDILKMFNEESCKLRKECPRIFVIQTCRGDGKINEYGYVENRSEVAHIQNPWRETIVLTPCVAGMMSNRDIEEGTWFIMALTEVLQKFAHSHSLDQMATMVNEKFEEFFRERGAKTQQVQCYIEYGVTKRVYFNPGM